MILYKNSFTRLPFFYVFAIFISLLSALLFLSSKDVKAQLVACDPATTVPCTYCIPANDLDPAAGCRLDYNASTCYLADFFPDPNVCANLPFPCNAGQPVGNCSLTPVCPNLGQPCTGPGTCCAGQGECSPTSGTCQIPATCSASGQACTGPAGTPGGCCDANQICQRAAGGGLTCQNRPAPVAGFRCETAATGCFPCTPGNTNPECNPPEYSTYFDCDKACSGENPNPVPIDATSGDTNAIPEPVVPCLEANLRGGIGVADPEFHSLRPYQASPCGDSPKTYFCNNDYFIGEPVRMRWNYNLCSGDPDGPFICILPPNAALPGSQTSFDNVYIIGGANGKDYQIGLSGVEFPILGNTQDVRNSQRNTEAIGHPEKMNEYVNWYLQGVVEKAEYGYEFPKHFVSYAGPTKKLLPEDFLNLQRLRLLHAAGTHAHPYFSIDGNEYQGNALSDPTFISEDPKNPNNVLLDQSSAHDQIAVCSDKNGLAVPCYGAGQREIWRLTEWWEQKGDQNINSRFFNWSPTSVWTSAIPPFRWQFRSGIYYMKAYAEWRGASCVIFNGGLYCANLGNLQMNACTGTAQGICQSMFGTISGFSFINEMRARCVTEFTSICLNTVDMRNNVRNVCTSLIRGLSGTFPPATVVLNTIAAPLCESAINAVIDRFPAANVVDTIPRNKLADLYRFIPLGNPSDKNAKHMVTGVSASGPTSLTIVRVLDYDIIEMPVLHYPHTQSTVEVSQLLNQTHTPIKGCGEGNNNCEKIKGLGEKYEPASCEFVDIRSNPGDSLTFKDDSVATVLQVDNVMTMVEQIECQNTGQLSRFFAPLGSGGCGGRTYGGCEITNCNKITCGTCGDIPSFCRTWPICRAEIIVRIPTSPKIPYADQIWKNTVVNRTSPFRRIFPKLVENAPVSCIADIPSTSPVSYSPTAETNLIKVETAGPNTYPGGSDAQLFFPHQGTIYEYFLKGIQTALRPKGMGGYANGQITNGDQCLEPFVCGNVVEDYGIPECVLQGIMAIETNQGTGGSAGCTSSNGRTYGCCTGIGCGPAQISCSQIGDFAGGQDIDVCDPCGAATLLARAMLLKLCQADGKCDSYDWSRWGQFVLNNYKDQGEQRAIEAACYFHGLRNGCYPSGCTQYRWGAGMSYGDAVERFCGSGAIPPTVQDFQFCDECSTEVERSGLPPLHCTI